MLKSINSPQRAIDELNKLSTDCVRARSVKFKNRIDEYHVYSR